MVSIEGVDYADARPSPSGLAAAGKHFVVRYGGPGRDSKQLHAAELTALLAAGLNVVANAEGSAGGLKGAAAGRVWAASALADFTALGMPEHRPIYFSADWDVQPSEYAGVDAALRAAADALGGVARVGIYGGYNIVAHCVGAGTARWFWQTYAWSGGRWHPAAHIQQYRNGVTVAGGDCDLDRAMAADYGQWGQGDTVDTADVNQIVDRTWNADGIVTNPTQRGDHAVNPTVRAAFALGDAWQLLYDERANLAALTGVVNALAATVAGIAADAVTEEDLATLRAAVDQVDDSVITALVGRTDEEVTAALRAALGDRATVIATLLLASEGLSA